MGIMTEERVTGARRGFCGRSGVRSGFWRSRANAVVRYNMLVEYCV